MPEDMKDVMEMMKSGKWDLNQIITHEFYWIKWKRPSVLQVM